MSIKTLIENAVNRNALGFANALKEELSNRIASSLNAHLVQEAGDAGIRLGGSEDSAEHADMAQMHREMAERHRKLGGSFNMKAAAEHEDAAKAQDAAAEHEYSYERLSKVHTKTHEPKIDAARAAFDKAAKQSKKAFSASHLASAEEQD